MKQAQLRWELGENGDFETGLAEWKKLHAAYKLPVLINEKSLKVALVNFGKGDERFAFGFQSGVLTVVTVIQSAHSSKYWLFQPEQAPLCFYIAPSDRDIILDLRSLLQALPIWALALEIHALDDVLFPFHASHLANRIEHKYETAFIELPDSLVDYSAKLSARFQHDLRRRTRKAEAELGAISFSVGKTPGEIPALVDLYADMESAGWKAQTGTALVRGGKQAKFYSDWLNALSEDGNAAIFTLNIGDKPAAMRLCVFDHTAMYVLKVSHNEALKVYGPGALHMHRLIQQVYANGSEFPRKIEYYGKLAESQKQWMTGTRSIRQVTAYRSQSLLKLRSFNWFGFKARHDAG
jgi:Acetyltransferase (GNAT) domain